MERLNDVFLKIPDAGAPEFVIDETDFTALVPKIVDAVKSVLPVDYLMRSAQQIANSSKVLTLNRTGFRRLMKALCKYVEFAPPKRESSCLCCRRDYLVHKSEFYCDAASPEDRAKTPLLADRREECFFLVSFLDRLFLKLLNHSGPYCDWPRLGKPDLVQKLP